MSFDMTGLGRTCMRLRSVIYTDDAGLNHRINRYCGTLLGNGQMYCERCEHEIQQIAMRDSSEVGLDT